MHKVLLVEDSRAIQQMYRSKLVNEHYSVVTADNGMEALKALTQSRPDVILLDLMMPVMDGYKVLQVVKTDSKLKEIPVIVFSGKGLEEEVQKAMALGASGYIVKSVAKPNEVVAKLREVLNQGPSEKKVARYRVEINRHAADAEALAADFGFGTFTCPSCRGPLLLDLIPDFSGSTPWFTATFFCPLCNAAQ